MLTPLRTRLFLSILVVLLIGMGTAVTLAWRIVEKQYLETQRENLLAQAELTAAALQGQPLPVDADQPYQQTSNVLPGIHSRLLSEQGAVLVGLPMPEDQALPAAENQAFIPPTELMERPEIAQALEGEPATAIRRVPTAGNRRVLYAAAPVIGEDGSVTALVYLAAPLPPGGLPLGLLLELLGAGLAAALLAASAGTFLARRIAHPVEAIAETAAAISAGNLGARVPLDSGIRELSELGQAFNAMTESLSRSVQTKNAFVANVTHELRTPLTVIKGTIETLEDGALDDIQGRGPLLASMQRETERLIRLVNDLLALSRADAGMLNLHLEPLDLGELARERCAHFAPLAALRQVRFDVRVNEEGGPVCAMGDADRLSQALDNLLDNALRYSPDGAAVTVEVSRREGGCQCAVRDCGPGIPTEHLPFIFERFYRADSSRQRGTGGSGLGLAIAQAFLQAQGGRIQAENSPGGGAALGFWLPATDNCLPTD